MVAFQTAVDIAMQVASGAKSATAVLEEHLARIDAREGEVHAFNLVTTEAARATAQKIDESVAQGRPVGPLAGVPIALKDNMCTRGVPTTCSSKILEGWKPPYDATVVTR
ncbi:MAG: aspartyl/glutamyl-tRNA(Asn/Gln) amidotransferase subunit, partial [Actinomycetota bacterium]